jgi:hypothetical protein
VAGKGCKALYAKEGAKDLRRFLCLRKVPDSKRDGNDGKTAEWVYGRNDFQTLLY